MGLFLGRVRVVEVVLIWVFGVGIFFLRIYFFFNSLVLDRVEGRFREVLGDYFVR